MNKNEFLSELKAALSGLPDADIEERLMFYSEMIDDRTEEGLSEEEAVLAIGGVEKTVEQIVAETPLTKLVKEKVKPKRALRVWEIIFLVLGSPIWLSLLVAFFSVVLSLYISVWSVIISLWSVFASVIGCAICGIVVGVGYMLGKKIFAGLALFAAGIVCVGLSVFLFYGCKLATKGIISLTKITALAVKKSFVKKEEA